MRWFWKFVQLFFKLFDGFLKHSFVLSFWFFKGITPVIIVVADESVVWSLSFFSIFEPFLSFFKNFIFFKVEMSLNNMFESFWWIFNVLNHCKFNVTISDDVSISLILLFSFNSSLFMFESGLIEVNLFRHDNGLNWDKNLQKSGNFWIPIFHCASSPSTQKTETYFSTTVKIGIKSDLTISGGSEVNFWWIVWISVIEVNIEQISTMPIWCSIWTHDQGLHEIDSFFITSYVNSICMLNW